MAVGFIVDLIGWWEYVVVLRYDRMNYSMFDLVPSFRLFMAGRERTVE